MNAGGGVSLSARLQTETEEHVGRRNEWELRLELRVRRELAQVVVPRGTELRKYVGENVEASIDELLEMQGEQQ